MYNVHTLVNGRSAPQVLTDIDTEDVERTDATLTLHLRNDSSIGVVYMGNSCLSNVKRNDR